MPDQAEPLERSQLVAAVAVGKDIVRCRAVAPRFVPGAAVDAALQALAEGRSGEAMERLKDIDGLLASPAPHRGRKPHRASAPGQHPGDFRPAFRIRPLFRRPDRPMRFNEINLFGLYVAPITVIMGVAWSLSRRQASVRPVRPDTACLASRPFRACALCYDRLVDCRYDRALEPLMSGVELKASDAKALPAIKRRSVLSSVRVLPILVTAVAVAVAAVAGWQAWQYYMGAPWTRDGTVRAYVVKIAPQVAGEIVQLPIADNQFVHKGDLLMLIDPRNYSIAVRQAEATVEQTRAGSENANAEMTRRLKLSDIAVTMEERQTYISQAATAEATYQSALANLEQARVNLRRTEVRSPVNGYVTNLTAQLGDYANVGDLQLSSSIPTRTGSTPISRRPLLAGSAKATPRRSSSWDIAPCCAAQFRDSRAASMFPTPRRTPLASPRSTRFSPSCASPNASPYASASTRFRRGSSSSPA